MITDLTATLTALLDQWDKRAAEAAQKIESAGQPVQGGFFAGVMFGRETARAELTAALALKAAGDDLS